MLQQIIDQMEISFQEFGGGTFLIRNGEVVGPDRLASVIARSGGSVRWAEEDCNRVFAVADFFDVHLPDFRYSEEDLISFATAFAEKLRTKLRTAFPGRRHVVEVVGGHLIDEEPLELCVTFRTLE